VVDLHIHTSRFQAFQPEQGVPIRITLSHPRWKLPYVLTRKVPVLAPGRDYFKSPPEVFRARYLEQLDEVGAAEIRRLLEDIAVAEESDSVVLLCYEDLSKPDTWCHRRLFAEWWYDQTGETVDDLAGEPRPDAPPPPAVDSMSLFG
jgi:hypothetical protein